PRTVDGEVAQSADDLDLVVVGQAVVVAGDRDGGEVVGEGDGAGAEPEAGAGIRETRTAGGAVERIVVVVDLRDGEGAVGGGVALDAGDGHHVAGVEAVGGAGDND